MDHLSCGCLSLVDLADLLDLNIHQGEVGGRAGLQMRKKNVGLLSENVSIRGISLLRECSCMKQRKKEVSPWLM